MKVALGADHAGFGYKDRIAQILRDRGYEIIDFGTHDDTPVDYPQYGYAVGEAVASGQADLLGATSQIQAGAGFSDTSVFKGATPSASGLATTTGWPALASSATAFACSAVGTPETIAPAAPAALPVTRQPIRRRLSSTIHGTSTP